MAPRRAAGRWKAGAHPDGPGRCAAWDAARVATDGSRRPFDRRPATPAGATETTFFTDSSGRSMGSADRFGDITFYNDTRGRPVGSSTRFGNQTFYDDPSGRSVGSSTTFGGDE